MHPSVETQKVRVLPALTQEAIAEIERKQRALLWTKHAENKIEPDGTSTVKHNKCLEQGVLNED